MYPDLSLFLVFFFGRAHADLRYRTSIPVDQTNQFKEVYLLPSMDGSGPIQRDEDTGGATSFVIPPECLGPISTPTLNPVIRMHLSIQLIPPRTGLHLCPRFSPPERKVRACHRSLKVFLVTGLDP